MLIDAHAHLYPSFDRARFLDAAVENLSIAGRALGLTVAPGALFLTETVRDEAFIELAEGRGLPPGWRAERPPGDPHAVWLHRPKGNSILLIAGRQLVSAEGVEVLAIGRRDTEANGLPAAEILARLQASDTPAVLPWGVGKWMGARGKLVARLIADRAGPGLILGDNAGRPHGWPTPSAFRVGLPVLPGTDPLPVAAAMGEAGSYGFVLDGDPDPDRPAVDIRARLMSLVDQPATFGMRTGLTGFALRQIQIRLG